MSRGQKIQQLLDYCMRREQLPALVAEVQERNSAQFARYAERLGDISALGTSKVFANSESTRHTVSLQRQLTEARENLRLIEERIAEL